jgi:hypothetical protein
MQHTTVSTGIKVLSTLLLSAFVFVAWSPPYRRPWPPPRFRLPPRICSQPWTTPGMGFAGDNIPIRLCIL